jgi:hypothetical protein
MKKIVLIILIFGATAVAQYKDTGLQTNTVKDGIVSPQSGNLFGFLNSDDFIMRHSFSMNYTSFSGQGISVGMYTNSMFYRLMDNLDVQADVSVTYSPYSTLGEAHQKSLAGIYLSNAAINYRPFKDFSVHLQYRNMPYGYGYYHPFYGFYNPVFDNSFSGYNEPANPFTSE